MKCVQLLGPSVGQNGHCCFYKAFKFCQPEQLANEILNGKSPGSLKSSRVLKIGQFFFVRTSPADDPCIGELQLLWHDTQTNQSLASVRLYFLPEQTPDGRRHHHGEHEVVAASEKVVLRLEMLGQWITDQVDWTHGILAPVVHSGPPVKLEANGHSTDAVSDHRPKNGLVNDQASDQSRVDSGTTTDIALKPGMNPSEKQQANTNGDVDFDIDSASVIVLSYQKYCRYRAMLLRLGDQCQKWLNTAIAEALGGIQVTSKNTRVLFCKDTFEHEGLFSDFNNCDHLAPTVKGRAKKKRLKNFVPVVARSQSPGSESNTSEELKSSLSVNSELTTEVSNGKKPQISQEEKDFLEKLFKFMQDRDTPINRVPHLGFKQIDLFFFYKYAQRLGGYNKVTCNKMWKHVYDEMGGNPGSTSAATCTRRHYERLLLPFENHLNGVDYKTPPPRKRKKDYEGSNDDDDEDDMEGDSLSGEGDSFDHQESRDGSVSVVVKEEMVALIKTELPMDEMKVEVKEELPEIIIEDNNNFTELVNAKSPKIDVPVLKVPIVKALVKTEMSLECPVDESAGSDEEGNIPLAFLPKVNSVQKDTCKVEGPCVMGALKLEVTMVTEGHQDSEVAILEAEEDHRSGESLSGQLGQKRHRVRDNLFSEKERRWNEIRKKNAMARTWIKKGPKSASTSPLPNRNFGLSTIPDQADCASCNLDSTKSVYSPILPSSNNHLHNGHLSHYSHHKSTVSPKPNGVPQQMVTEVRHNVNHNLHRLPPSLNLLESSSKPLPIANPSPASCGYITCGIRNPNCCSPTFGNAGNIPIVKHPSNTKVNNYHSPSADKSVYRGSIYSQHPVKELHHVNNRIPVSHPRSLSPTNQPRPSVIQHTEKIHSPPPAGGSQPLPAHLSSSKSIPLVQAPNATMSSSRSRSFHPTNHKSRSYDVASLRTSSISSRSVNSQLKAPDIYAKSETSPLPAPQSTRKEMPSLLPIRSLPDCFFQQSAKHSSLVKSLSYTKEPIQLQQMSQDTSCANSYSRKPNNLPVASNYPVYQRNVVQVSPALTPSAPVYLQGDSRKAAQTHPCDVEVLDLSVKRKSNPGSSVQMEQEWPVFPIPEGECLDLSMKKRKVDSSPMVITNSLSKEDEARGIENVTPPSPIGEPTLEPVISDRIPSMLATLKTPITSLNFTRALGPEKVQANSIRRSENRSPPLLIPLTETRTPYGLESELIAQHQRQLQRKASEYAAYQQYANGQLGSVYQSNSWPANQSLIHQSVPHRTSVTHSNGPRSPNENLAAYSEMVERSLIAGQIPYALAPHLYPLMYKDSQHYQPFSK